MTSSPKTDNITTVEVVPGGPVSGCVRPPGSKSLTNRALICAAFANSPSVLRGALRSEDTEVMIDSLAKIGVQMESDPETDTISVDPTHRVSDISKTVEMSIANSGTSIRFLVSALSADGGRYLLRGVDRMHARPIGDLVDAIQSVLDGSIQAVSPGQCPPVELQSRGWSQETISVTGNVSSQYLSGLMMAAPIAHAHRKRTEPISLRVTGELVSRPYVEMTAKVMESFGSQVKIVDTNDGLSVLIPPSSYQGHDYWIEPDASAASYFWAVAAITGGTITVNGLHKNAMQGDVGFVDVLSKMGCQVTHQDDSITVQGGPLVGVDVDMNAISDTVQTLAVVALFAKGPTRVRGVAHNRFKETDRIGDLATELRKLGATVEEHQDGLTISPPDRSSSPVPWSGFGGASLETYDDHRMAMSLSLAGLRMNGVKIQNPACTGKTYPEYFADLETLLGRPHHWA